MRVLIAGGTGLIGGELTVRLRRAGHETLVLSRHPRLGQVGWDPARGWLDREALDGVDAIVNLAGESIGGRWTGGKRAAIFDSRVRGTELLANLAGELGVRRFVSASAVGFYGDRADEVLVEDSPPGSGFLADVCAAWEAATAPAGEAGVPVSIARIGIVLTPDGGSLQRMLTPFRFGLGGRLGSGRQWWSWISLPDVGRALTYVLERGIDGPLNIAAPEPVTNEEFTEVLAATLGRPAVVSVPAAALKMALGSDFTEEVLLASQRVHPRVLAASGFEFDHSTLPAALAALL